MPGFEGCDHDDRLDSKKDDERDKGMGRFHTAYTLWPPRTVGNEALG